MERVHRSQYRRRNIDIPIPPKYRVNIPGIFVPVATYFALYLNSDAKYRYGDRTTATDAVDDNAPCELNCPSPASLSPSAPVFVHFSAILG